MTALRIAPDLALPVDAVTQAMAILARRGAGKTHTASVLVEEVVKAHQPVVVLDPTGAWWGLRSSADGKKPGLPVVILGGEHGDVPLESTAGKVIADVVVDHPGAYVLDLSGFESNAAQDRFVADFLERLYRAKATRRDALLLVVDEADSFAPQRPQPGQQRMLGSMEAVVRRGRIRGLGVVLISQRAAVLNKNVLTQIEVLIALQTTSPQDRAAIDAWRQHHQEHAQPTPDAGPDRGVRQRHPSKCRPGGCVMPSTTVVEFIGGILSAAGSSSAITDTMCDGLGQVLDPPAGAVSRLEDLAP